MITFTGRYNSANVMIDEVDETTRTQILTFLGHPAFANTYIAIMPDCHAGAGAVIGFTAKMNEYVIPNVVGVDIGCGITAYELSGVNQLNMAELDGFVKLNIPSGFAHRQKPMPELFDYGEIIDYQKTALSIGLDSMDVMRQLGTLGGGNHFIEIDKDPNGLYWLVVHTGSRNFGLQIATYYQNKAKELMRKFLIGDAHKQLEFLPIDSGEGKGYLMDMEIAQKFAQLNRFLIADTIIRKFFCKDTAGFNHVESVHNYIDNPNHTSERPSIIRKGAISAYKDEPVIIPLNMRDGTIIGTGKGSSKWNYSAPHGAGRILSRTKAKQTLHLEQFAAEMKGVYSTCINYDTLDESPMAYKDKDIIINAIQETVDISFIMKPVYNFKASEK
jgi:tRNA-splicing ligase RtcB